MKYFKKLLNFVYNQGVSEQFDSENEMTGLMNIMSFFDVIGAGFLFLVAYFLIEDTVYQLITGLVTIAYFVIIILNHFEKIHEARLYFALVIPCWYAAALMLIGGYFGQSIIACTGLIITALNYAERPKLRNFLIIYSVTTFIGATVYINLNGPILGLHDHLFDEIIAVVLCLGWIYAVCYIYEKRNKEYIISLQKKNQLFNEKTLELERFTTITSHDLKSPLQNISNFLKVMDTDIRKKDYSNLQSYLGYAKSSAYRMRELIEGVLEVSTNSNDQVINCERIDLNDLLKQVLTTNKKELNEKNAIVTSGILPVFNCNPADFIIIFQNLILNGIKYNQSDNPKIVINTKNSKHHYILQFTDNGIGIEEKYYQEVFQYFKRLHNHSTYPGSGLGLGLCKKIVEKYHGAIEIDSIVGAYTSFKVILPKNWENLKEQIDNQTKAVTKKQLIFQLGTAR